MLCALFFIFLSPFSLPEEEKAYYLVDEAENLTIEDILGSKVLDSLFIASDPKEIDQGFSSHSVWIKFENLRDEERQFIISNAALDSIEVFKIKNGEVAEHIMSGDALPFDTREVSINQFVFSLPSDYDNIIFRVRTEGVVSIPVKILNEADFIDHVSIHNIFNYIYVGFFLVIALLNIILFLRLRESLYIYYLLMVIASALIIGIDNGLFFKWIWPNKPQINAHALLFYATSFFMLRIFHVVYVTCVIIVICSFAGFYRMGIQLVTIMGLLTPFILITSGFIVFRKTLEKSSLYYLVGWGIYSILIVIYILSFFGWVPVNTFTGNAIQIGQCAEITIIFLAVVDKIEFYKKQQEHTQQELIGILENQTSLLESKVEERTHDLQEKNNELNKTLRHLKRTQAQLLQSEKMASLGTLTAGVAHELNNPLNFIRGAYVNLSRYLAAKGMADPKVDELMRHIEFGVEKSANIVSGLNQFSRDNAPINEKCNIHDVIENCLLILKNKLTGKIEVVREYSANIEAIPGNVGKLHQVFLNILTNAFQAIKDQGRITITTAILENYVRVEIKDTGMGIREENLSKIFDPFFTTKDPGEGTGLGLSITYSLVEEHGGQILMSSVENEGTVVSVKLPLDDYKN